ncbi:MAG: nucleotide exchange factor GrpE [Pseudomonadota bacterium]
MSADNTEQPEHSESTPPESASEDVSHEEEAGQPEGSGSAEDSQQSDDSGAAEDEQPVPAEELAQAKDQLLRTLADMENLKRRTGREVENAHKFAVEKLLSDLIPVLDSLDKAVETAQATDGAQAIGEGVALSVKLFVDTLSRSGVEVIDPLGEPFDPQVHEAMTMVPNPAAEPNSVMDVMAKGYVLNGRLVRAAKVIVVKGE